MNLIQTLEIAINTYNKIILLQGDFESFIDQADFSMMSLDDKKILILSEGVHNPNNRQITYRQVDISDMGELKHIYYMYEFTDNFVILGDCERFANIFNFVKSGMLSVDEAWQALFC